MYGVEGKEEGAHSFLELNMYIKNLLGIDSKARQMHLQCEGPSILRCCNYFQHLSSLL